MKFEALEMHFEMHEGCMKDARKHLLADGAKKKIALFFSGFRLREHSRFFVIFQVSRQHGAW